MIASTGRPEEADYLKGLGAAEVIDRKEIRPAPAARQGALGRRHRRRRLDDARKCAVDDALWRGGRRLRTGRGNGLAGFGRPVHSRGVSLLGINSVMCPLPLRREAWRRLEADLDRGKIAAMTSEIGLADVIAAGQRIVDGQVRGRIVVKIG